jgi:hypothetical protein
MDLVSHAVPFQIMCVAVDFDDQSLLRAKEIDNAIVDDVLSAELVPAKF